MDKRSEAIVKNMQLVYDKFVGHQLAAVHGTTRDIGDALKAGTIKSFPADKQWRDRILIGGYGSGKTRGAIYKVWNDSIFYPNNQILVVQKRHEVLRNTFVRQFKEMAEVFTEGHPEWLILDERENAGSFEIDVFTGSKPSTIIFRVEPDGDDETIEGSFRAYEAGGIVFEEGSRLRKITYNTGIGRLRRKITDNGLEPPLGTPIKGWKPFSILCTNPAFEGHWLAELAREYETSVAANERCLGVVIRSTMEDNPGLPKEHIEREKLKYKNDPIGYDMFILGRDGIKVDGRPVFVNDFKFELHVNKDLKYNPMLPIIRGLDWGYNYPACVWVQIDDVGRKNILAELQGREMEAQNFAKLVLDKSKQWFPLCHKWRDWGDPSGFFQTDKGVTAQIVNAAGLNVKPAGPNNDPDRRIALTRRLLSRNIMGRPEVQLGPRVPLLQLAFRQGYYYRVDKNGEIASSPTKNNKFDNIMDAAMYALEGETRGYDEEINVARWGGETIAAGPERLEVG